MAATANIVRHGSVALEVATKENKMPESSDQVVQHARDRLREQIEKCSQRAAQKIAARLKSVHSKPTVALLAELIAREFEELNR